MNRVQRLATVSVVLGLSAVAGLWIILKLFLKVDIMQALGRIDFRLIALALVLHFLFWIFWGARTWVLSKGAGFFIKPFKAFEIVLSSLFAASITPSYAGGEPIRFYLLAKRSDGGKAGAVVFIERFFDTSFFAFISLVSAFYLYISFKIPFLKWVFFFSGIVIIFLLIVFFISFKSTFLLEGILNWFLSPLTYFNEELGSSLKIRVEKGVKEFQAALRLFMDKGRAALVVGGVFTTFQWLSEFLIPYVLFQGLGVNIGVIEAIAGNAILTFLLLIPLTPGGSGLAELGSVGVFRLFVSSPSVALFPLPWRIITYYTNLFVGLLVSAILLKEMALLKEKIV